ncbi:MAG: hypothetical protein EOL93_05495 [Epsilonproteobacteria bacterium]|nr:hypothetical protein [Campylobacterota bacterium]
MHTILTKAGLIIHKYDYFISYCIKKITIYYSFMQILFFLLKILFILYVFLYKKEYKNLGNKKMLNKRKFKNILHVKKKKKEGEKEGENPLLKKL